MMENKQNRRNFLKTLGAAGLGSVFAAGRSFAEPNTPDSNSPAAAEPKYPQMPRRKLGKTGIEVPILSLGAMFDIVENQMILRNTLQWGVNYWDTAYGYAGGNSEIGIGKFLAKKPEVRKDLFLVTKASGAKTVEDIEKHLKESLERMNTSYVDLYYGIHGCDEPAQLTNELKDWAKSAKERKLIKFFGFSTHKNMAKCLTAAAKLDWIDAIMTSYNIRLMQEQDMQDGIDACHKAGIGLIAMKVQSGGQKIETEADQKLTRHFLDRGFTEGQAKIKAVIDDTRIATACLQMRTAAFLTENAAAALDKSKLTARDMDVFKQYAQATCSGYCAGCANICDAALPDSPYVSEVMRSLMYYNSYGDQALARDLFAQIPADIRSRLTAIDYRVAEASCPRHLPIAQLMSEAVTKLA